jgi:phosphohistidine phosphatase
MCREAVGMKHLHLRLDAVYTSPYPRAAETAEIVCDTLGLETLHTDERLSAGNFRLGNLQLLLKSLSPNARILLVGHEPDLSALIQNLTGAVIDMKKGGLALVETIRPEPGYGVLLWLLTPRHLTAMR